MKVINQKIDFWLIKFPIIFPVIYFLILYAFPNSETYLIFFTILLLAEPHFAATWPIFINTKNKQYIKKNKLPLIYGNLFILFFCIFGFFYFRNSFLLIFYLFNIYHVTKQSAGILKLYESKNVGLVFKINAIYIFNSIFFLVGFFKFYTNIIPASMANLINYCIYLSIIFTIIIFYFKYRNLKKIFLMISGIIIFLPICFVTNPVHAILMGVTIHYSQYLIITSKVKFGREGININNLGKLIKTLVKNNFLKFILIYSLLMTFFSLSPMLFADEVFLKNLLLIPITFQMLHFYIDSYIWRFKDKHNRDEVLKYILND